MSPLGSYLRSRGIKDGLIKGRKLWSILGLLAWSIRLLAKMGRRRPETVAREVLAPGQSIVITSVERSDSR